MSLLERLKQGLEKSRHSFAGRIASLFAGEELNSEFYDQLEELLVLGDVGVETSIALVSTFKEEANKQKIKRREEAFQVWQDLLVKELEGETGLNLPASPPAVVLVLGVNGVGKTTTIGKLAYNFSSQGKQVIVAAGDTFRAAAIEQLRAWADKSGAQLVAHQEGSDPAAVIYDGVNAAVARGADFLICDTAGRLHTKKNLMEELKKIYRVLNRTLAAAPHEVLLVIDATTGQNALVQAKLFNEAAPLTGLVVTKLDGTAKGGILLAVRRQLGIPVKFVGVGEGIEDLQPFDPLTFVQSLFSG